MVVDAPVTARFWLIDDWGTPVAADHFLGRFALIYFGFTHCKVICPRSLSKLSAVLERVDPDGARIAALYVTVDPERDTPAVMRSYLAENHPRFIGLTGTRGSIDEAKRNFRVFAERRAATSDGDYDVPHTAIAYFIDPEGRYRTHFAEAVDEDAVVARIEDLLGEDQARCER